MEYIALFGSFRILSGIWKYYCNITVPANQYVVLQENCYAKEVYTKEKINDGKKPETVINNDPPGI
jgi:hypothetical protein